MIVPLITFVLVMFLLLRKGKPPRVPDPLEAVVLDLGVDAITLRDMNASILVTGMPGSGKTTGSMVALERGLLRNNTGLLILESKPEKSFLHDRLIKEAGREADHIKFGPGYDARMNVFDALAAMGADAKQYTMYLLTLSEVIGNQGGSGTQDPIWALLKEQFLEAALEMLIQAYPRFTIVDLERFISTAPYSREELKDPSWRDKFCNATFRIVDAKKDKTPVQQRSYEHSWMTWIESFSSMAEKMRSSMISDVNSVLHPLSTGHAWQLLSTKTTVTPSDLMKGRIIDCRCPVSRYGATGAVINGSLKFITQLACVARHAEPSDTIVCILMDEYWQHITTRDPGFLNECRSHNACMCMLLQSIHSIHSALRAKGEHKGEELLGSVGLKICHTLSDAKSAEYFSGLLGMRDVTKVGGTDRSTTHGDEIFGDSGFTANFSLHREPILEPRRFLTGLRSGQGGKVNGILIRNGIPFRSTNECYMFVEFTQS